MMSYIKNIHYYRGIYKKINIVVICMILLATVIIFLSIKLNNYRSLFRQDYPILSSATKEQIGLYTGSVNEAGIPDDNKGTIILSDGTKCTGSWKDGSVVGKFTCVFPNGSTYKGTISSEYRPNGNGIFTYINGDVIEGEYSWVSHFVGSQYAPLNNSVYTGMILNNEPTGYGKYVSMDNTASYCGEFKNGRCDGIVEYISENKYLLTLNYVEGSFNRETVTFSYYSGESDPVIGQYRYCQNEPLESGIYKGYHFTGILIDGIPMHGELKFPIGSLYSGSFVNGRIHAQNATYTTVSDEKLVLSNVSWVIDRNATNNDELKSTYTGMIVDKERCGYGVALYSNGEVYTGEYLANSRNGYGVYQYDDNSSLLSYEGFWVNSKQQGTGTLIWKNGNKYEGSFENDYQHGPGTMTYIDGDVYTGLWEKNVPNGEGTMEFANGDVYTGSWVNGRVEGQGKMTYENGTVYNGAWKDGNQHGYGITIYADSDAFLKYDGNWENSSPHGQGTMEYASGDVYTGSWVNGNREGQGKMIYENGDIYEGFWEKNEPNGEGTFTWNSTGVYFKGNFVDGYIEGYGTFYPKSSRPISDIWTWVRYREETVAGYDGIYEGMMSNQMLNGYGIFTHNFTEPEYDGISRIIEGEFKDGNVHGYIKCTQLADEGAYITFGEYIDYVDSEIISFYTATNGAFSGKNTIYAHG